MWFWEVTDCQTILINSLDASTWTGAETILVLCIDKTEDLQPPSVVSIGETKTVNEYSIKKLIEGDGGMEVDEYHREGLDM